MTAHSTLTRRARLTSIAVLGLLLLGGGSSIAQAAQSTQRVTPKFKDANIRDVAEAACQLTGRTCILDPRVVAQVTVLSDTELTPAQFYELFLATLQVHGFVATTVGNFTKVVQDANARQMPSNDLPARINSGSDEFVTQVVSVKSVSAAQLVPVLRPMMPQSAQLAAVTGSNMLILADRASSVARMLKIIARIDQGGSADIDVIPLQNAGAADTVRVLTALQTGAGADAGGAALRMVADDRSNSILISGDADQRLRIKSLIAHLDTPQDVGADTQVKYLRYAVAEDLATKLKEQLSATASSATATTVVARGQANAAAAQAAANAAAAGSGATNLSLAGGTATIWAYAPANALVMTAPQRTLQALQAVIDKLDIRRASVQVNAIVVEVQAGKESELGVNWVADASSTNLGVGGFIQPVGGTTIVDLYGLATGSTAASVPLGTTVGVGRLAASGVNFAAVLRALQGDSRTNVKSAPSITVLDNEEATLGVSQEVPFVTGQYTGTTGTSSAFQTIQREEVGTILKVTPQINQGDAVLLKLEVESSSLAETPAGAADLVTNKRTINTSVIVKDGDMLVLGGLIQDTVTNSEQRVPLLGRIPLIGELFRTRSTSRGKTNLMVFIQPKILRDDAQAALETNSKYQYIRDQQRQLNRETTLLPILPFEKPEPLPADPQQASDPAAGTSSGRQNANKTDSKSEAQP